jgi:hypothetical protein
MFDRHSNLFYTYNRDTELIENNLTRAWIVSLSLLSGEVKDGLLKALLEKPFRSLGAGDRGGLPSFLNAEFALQGYMDDSETRKFPHKYILTIASDRREETGQDNPEEEDSPENREKGLRTTSSKSYLGSIPDAWIFDKEEGYCFLIEAKVGLNPIDDKQVKAHAAGWFGLDPERIQDHLLPLTWVDVLHAINQVRTDQSSDRLSLNAQECQILNELEEYLGFFGYRLFHGLDFEPLRNPPKYRMSLAREGRSGAFLFALSDLDVPPLFQLITD